MTKTGINMGNVKRNNRAQILKLMNRTGPISKKDIAEQLGLTPAAVTLLCGDLIEEGILVESGILPGELGKAGRKKVSIDINEDYGYIYSINLDSRYTEVSICNAKGVRKGGRTLKTDSSVPPEDFLKKIAKNCEQVRKQADLPADKILGGGIGLPGQVEPESGASLMAYGVWKERVEVGKILSALLDKPVAVENNVNCHATAELLFGKGRECNSFLLVKWGPGVGTSIVHEGNVFYGEEGRTAELGHMIVRPGGRKCNCGKEGCLEAYLSYEAMSSEFGEFSMGDFGSLIKGLPKEKRKVWEEAADLFAQNIVNAAVLLGIDDIVLSGQMFADENVRNSVISAAERLAGQNGRLSISCSNLLEEEKYIGPAAYFIQKQCIQL